MYIVTRDPYGRVIDACPCDDNGLQQDGMYGLYNMVGDDLRYYDYLHSNITQTIADHYIGNTTTNIYPVLDDEGAIILSVQLVTESEFWQVCDEYQWSRFSNC